MAQFNKYDEAAAVAQEYAVALLPLAEQAGTIDETLSELEQVEQLLSQDAEVREVLSAPVLSSDAAIHIVEKAFRGRVSDLVCDTLAVLARNGRMAILPAVVRALLLQVQAAKGEREVEVTTAVPVSDAEMAAIAESVKARIGATPVLRMVVDATLLGGLKIRVGDQVIDASVAGQLEQMKEAMLRRQAASRT